MGRARKQQHGKPEAQGRCDPNDPCPTNRCLVDEEWCNNLLGNFEGEKEHGKST